MTPALALQLLEDGNLRFVKGEPMKRNLREQTAVTAEEQYPFATILGCIDSRIPHEHVFDLGIGDVFSVRIAGNIINSDILGSLEFACKIAGAKLILVLGHTNCGAVKGACDNIQLENLTGLLSQIRPAVLSTMDQFRLDEQHSANPKFVGQVSKKNVENTIQNIREMSSVLAQMEQDGEIAIVGGMYDLSSGKVSIL